MLFSVSVVVVGRPENTFMLFWIKKHLDHFFQKMVFPQTSPLTSQMLLCLVASEIHLSSHATTRTHARMTHAHLRPLFAFPLNINYWTQTIICTCTNLFKLLKASISGYTDHGYRRHRLLNYHRHRTGFCQCLASSWPGQTSQNSFMYIKGSQTF